MPKIKFDYKSLDEVKFNNLVSLWEGGIITIKNQNEKIKELEKEFLN